MTPEVYIPLLSALAGALIGTAGTVAAVAIQSRKEDRRHRREMAVKIASDQQAQHIEAIRATGGGFVMPVDLYLMHALTLIDALEKGKLTKEKLEAINDELEVVAEFLNDRAKTRMNRKAATS